MQSIPTVWQDMERERKRTQDAEHAARERALQKLKWKYEREGEFKPFGTVPQAAAYGFERGAAGIAGGIENILSGASELKNNTMHKLTSMFGDNFISDEYKRRAELAQKVRAVDDWRQSIEERYEPTEGMRKAGDFGETIGNMMPSIGFEALATAATGGGSLVTKGILSGTKVLPKVGMAAMALNSYGAGSHRAAMEGADTDTAALYGALSAAGETITESMFDAIPGIKSGGFVPKGIKQIAADSGITDAAQKVGAKFAGTATGRALSAASRAVQHPAARYVGGILGEGVEEVAMAVADPYFQRMTYDPAAQNATKEQVMQDAFMGVLISGIMQGGAMVRNRIRTGRNSEKNHVHSAPRNAHIPDFEAQWNRYNQMGQSGIRFEDVPQYETETPVDYETAFSAHAEGWNDFIERTTETAKRILAGEETNLGNIAETVVSPDGKQILEEGLGFSFSENIPEAVKQAQTIANALHQKVQQETVGQRQQTGVIQNEVSRAVDKKTVKAVSRIAERLGVAVEFTDDMAEAGSYADGKIRINTKSNDLTKPDGAIRQVFVHELTHALEQSGEYQALSQAILSEIDEAGALSEVREQLRERYVEHGQELDDTGLDREIVAWFSEENLFTDERAINNLARKNRSLFQRIRDWLHGVRVKLKGTAEEKFIWQAEQLYQKVFNSITHDAGISAKSGVLGISENGQKNNASGETQYRIAKTTSGESFVDVDETSLDGKDRNAILKALKQTIKQKFIPHVTANGQDFQITGKTVKEWTWSQNAQQLYQKNTQVFYDKVNSFHNADELLEASGNYQSETPKHPRKDNFTSFGRGKVLFRVDGRGYEADIVIGITKKGEAMLYDIVNLKNKKIAESP